MELNICFINLLLPTSDVIITLKIVLMLYVISLLRFPSKAAFTTAIRQTSQNRLYKMEAVRKDLFFLPVFFHLVQQGVNGDIFVSSNITDNT